MQFHANMGHGVTADPVLQCDHQRTEPRLRRLSNGTEAVWSQCLDCGAGVRALPKRDYGPADLSRMAPYDADLERALWEQRLAARREASSAQRQQERAEWWEHYTAYLRSPQWAERRRLVLERDRWRCTALLPGCTGRATEVHHVTYRHQAQEPLFELTSVCHACHEAITAMDREARGEDVA